MDIHTHTYEHTIATWVACFSVVQEQTLLFFGITKCLHFYRALLFRKRNYTKSYT